MMVIKVWQNMVDNQPYTGYGSHYSKCLLVRHTVPVLQCRIYGSYSLQLTALVSGGLTKNLEVKFFLAQISILWVHVAWCCCVLCYYTFK